MMSPNGDVTFGTSGTEKLEVARWKEEWFLSADPYSLTPPGFGDLLNTPLDDITSISDDSLSARIDHPERYRDVDLDTDPFPARLTGIVSDSSGPVDESVLAIGLNGRVEAVVRTYNEDGTTRFQAMLPPEAFRPGENEIRVLLVTGFGADRTFTRPVGQ